jgi:FADH2 O2-dependent halogenase
MKNNGVYDVIIMGGGIGGSMLAAILAKHDLRVLLVEAEVHPRFTIGEATTPDTNFRLKLLGVKYGVPEIVHLSAFHTTRDYVSPASGVKRAFSFVYQRDGKEQNPKETHQYPTLAPPMGPDCHFFRQDTDAYMLAIAMTYGADVRQQTRVAQIDIADELVTLGTAKGEVFTGRYLVDATGMKSVLAHRFNLRDDPESYKTNSRAIFTHMVNVKHYDEVGAAPREYGLKYPMSQSTLHHVFEGGWMWVIPFNNHVDAVNPLCSVGLVLNREIHPETGMDAEEEFFAFINRHPAVARQFKKAKAVRNWITTGRLQYGATNLVGYRYCLLSHAAGFIDPLYSSGLVLTTATVDMLAKQLLKSFATNDFSVEQFAHIDRFFQTSIRCFDDVVSSSFVAFRDYKLWDAWFRVWVVGLLIGTALNANLYLRYLETKDKRVLDETEKEPYTGVLGLGFPEFRQLFDRALDEINAVRAGGDPQKAGDNIRSLFKALPYVPTYFQWHDAKSRTTPAFTCWGMTRMYFWYILKSPRHVRKLLFDWKPLTAYMFILSSIWESNRLSRRRKSFYIRDVFKAWNKDWVTESTPEGPVKELQTPRASELKSRSMAGSSS